MRRILLLFVMLSLLIPGVTQSSAQELPGDLDQDGVITGEDIQRLFRYTVGLVELSPEESALADTNEDGSVDGSDVQCIFCFSTGLAYDEDAHQAKSFGNKTLLDISECTVTPIDTVILVGQTILVDVIIENAPTIKGYTLDFTFDSLKMEYVSVSKEDTLSSGYNVFGGNEFEAGRVRITGAPCGGPPVSGSGVLLRVELRAKEGAEGLATVCTDRLLGDLRRAGARQGCAHVEMPTPTPTAPRSTLTPTPTTRTISENDFEEVERIIYDSPSGCEPATIGLGDIPSGSGTNGRGLIVQLDPGEGVLVFQSSPVPAEAGPVLVSVCMQATGSAGCSIGLAALNDPVDGQVGYMSVNADAMPVGEWKQIRLVYDPPDNGIWPGVHATLSDSAPAPVEVYFDNLVVSEMAELEYDNVPLDGAPDGRIFVTGLRGGFPLLLEAAVYARRSGLPGVMSFLMINRTGRVGALVNNNSLAITAETPQTMIVGGSFWTQNSAYPSLCVVTNGGPEVESAVVINSLRVRHIVGGL